MFWFVHAHSHTHAMFSSTWLIMHAVKHHLILTTMFQRGLHSQTNPAGKVMQYHALNKYISNSALLIAALKFIHSFAKGKRSIVLLVDFRRRKKIKIKYNHAYSS